MLTLRQCADELGIAVSTLSEYLQMYPELNHGSASRFQLDLDEVRERRAANVLPRPDTPDSFYPDHPPEHEPAMFPGAIPLGLYGPHDDLTLAYELGIGRASWLARILIKGGRPDLLIQAIEEEWSTEYAKRRLGKMLLESPKNTGAMGIGKSALDSDEGTPTLSERGRQ